MFRKSDVFLFLLLSLLGQLLPESCVDAMELLSYLDPPDLGGGASSAGGAHAGPASSSATAGSTPANDDLLALFEP